MANRIKGKPLTKFKKPLKERFKIFQRKSENLAIKTKAKAKEVNKKYNTKANRKKVTDYANSLFTSKKKVKKCKYCGHKL